jgi:hypothetical protein
MQAHAAECDGYHPAVVLVQVWEEVEEVMDAGGDVVWNGRVVGGGECGRRLEHRDQ